MCVPAHTYTHSHGDTHIADTKSEELGFGHLTITYKWTKKQGRSLDRLGSAGEDTLPRAPLRTLYISAWGVHETLCPLSSVFSSEPDCAAATCNQSPVHYGLPKLNTNPVSMHVWGLGWDGVGEGRAGRSYLVIQSSCIVGRVLATQPSAENTKFL